MNAGPHPALQSLEQQARQSNTAAVWRQLADAAAKAGAYPQAEAAYRQEAAIYRRVGDPNAAQIEEMKAQRWHTELTLHLHRTRVTALELPSDTKGRPALQRLEPATGCYLGAFIDRDDTIPSMMMQSQMHGDIEAFVGKVAKPHASYFMYRSYGQAFPSEWASYVRGMGAIPHVSWEPSSLAQVADDNYLRGFVDDVARLDWPVFIRFAGEMNGDWTPYHGNPAAYRKAFRTVHRALRRAPKAALIWCPNTVPQNRLDDYYPGDDACDWVGVNMYSVLFFDNDPARPAEHVHPADLLSYVYERYSARKPICIAEYAATHRAAVDPRSRPGFAVSKMRQLYCSLPARYPRVKMVDWFDCNNLTRARPGRQLNNYLLTDNEAVLEAYREVIASPWFLGTEVVDKKAPSSPVEVVPLKNGASIFGGTGIQAHVRTYVEEPRVYFRLDGRVVMATKRLDRHFLPLDPLSTGRHRIEVLVFDDRDRLVASRAVEVVR